MLIVIKNIKTEKAVSSFCSTFAAKNLEDVAFYNKYYSK